MTLVLLFGSAIAVSLSGALDDVTVDSVRSTISEAGPWGVLLFLVIFVVGELVHIPGMVFVVAAVLAWGRWEGFGAAFVGAVLSVSVTFIIVRTLGGTPLGEVRFAWARKLLARLEQHPITTIVILRTLLWIAPPLNYALAMSRVRFRDFLIGSAVGLFAPILVVAIIADVATERLLPFLS